MDVDNMLYKLSLSKFRSSFHLRKYMIDYINKVGMDEIKKHAYDFINKRLKPKTIINDGKQTPMKGHPVFIAQHATSTCCRCCLYKWHHIEKEKELSSEEVDYIVNLIMKWIDKEYKKSIE